MANSMNTLGDFKYENIAEPDEINVHVQPNFTQRLKVNKSKVVAGICLCIVFMIYTVFDPKMSLDIFGSTRNYRVVMHISDTHIDPLFDPTMSMSTGICHSCELKRSVFGKDTKCPQEFLPNNAHIMSRTRAGYSFGTGQYTRTIPALIGLFLAGRIGCNPPHLLLESLRKKMLSIDPNPKIIVFTGDISPHGYPDDDFEVDDDTDLGDLCNTKFLVTKHLVEDLVQSFPNTRWAYTLGNNDHFPKDVYWQPYLQKYGDMLLETGFFTSEQHEQVRTIACDDEPVPNTFLMYGQYSVR